MNYPHKAVALLCTALMACHAWQPMPPAIEQNSIPKGSSVRLQKRDGARLELYRAQLKPDSLIGRAGDQRIAVAMSDISKLELAKFSGDRTAVAVVLGVLAVPVAFVLLLLISGASLAPEM